MKRFRLPLLLLLGATVSIFSCVKQTYDLPPDTTGYDPKLQVNMSIRGLIAMNGLYSSNGTGDDTMRIDSNLTLSGIVTANDKSGNFYKQIVIQDSTGALAVNLDDYRLYANYPVGRKIYVKLQGLMLSYNGGTPVLGADVDDKKASQGLAGTEITDHIVKGNVGNVAKDTVVDFDVVRNYTQADAYLLNRLITIRGLQFADTGVAYTNPTATTNRNLQTCASTVGTLTMRTSNYADFHSLTMPTGNGDITGIYTVFISTSGSSKTPQLLIRDTSDVKFNNLRCGPLFGQDFTLALNGEIVYPGWTNVAVTGGLKWKKNTAGSSTNPFAVMTGFTTGVAVIDSWLVTPGVDLPAQGAPYLVFRNNRGFDNGATLKLYLTDNFTGDVTTTTWVETPYTQAPSNPSAFSTFTSSGNINLSAYAGKKVWVAWRYEGGDPNKTTSWEIDDVSISL